MTKGIEVRDLIIGAGDSATKENVVSANVKQFLRRGDEVSHSPAFGYKQVIDLGARHNIPGLIKGIPGMRVGGKREIIISPHLAYGEMGIPGRIPSNALLRCEVELLDIRAHSALLPEDWFPGKLLTLTNHTDDNQPRWSFLLNESGNSQLNFVETLPGLPKTSVRISQIPIIFDAEASARLIQQAVGLPTQMPEDCAYWDSGYIERPRAGGAIIDRRSGARCMVFEVRNAGEHVCIFGAHVASERFRNSIVYKTIERAVGPHLSDASS